jgi:hypothetical protein
MKKRKYTKGWDDNPRAAETKKKKINSSLIWTIFIAFIMVTSIVGYMWFGSDEPEFEYNGHKILRGENDYVYIKDGNEFMFTFFPGELENLANQTDLNKIKKQMFYVTFDPNSELAEAVDVLRFEFSTELPKINVFMGQGMLNNESAVYNFPVIDCSDATENVPVIKFVKGNETKITEQYGCFTVEAKNAYDVIKIKDLILYSLLGVI